MKLDPQLLEFAKTMRSNATDAENLMWELFHQDNKLRITIS